MRCDASSYSIPYFIRTIESLSGLSFEYRDFLHHLPIQDRDSEAQLEEGDEEHSKVNHNDENADEGDKEFKEGEGDVCDEEENGDGDGDEDGEEDGPKFDEAPPGETLVKECDLSFICERGGVLEL
eukprot:CAMPEP_0174899438 /NCGR_PEP_ID=MMETSP0167-20121228/27190_1 /TAXON_ID=38298 /ORGANISM="Rhodella maculata, Strain CCMP736" /LENGTH=125 /DNA_ID=CAMNT_0016140457 /DNA_START=18 /DNA_END=395 /DNA_ORIENTATION=+